MTSLSGGDMWSRVSQRQICASVCHLKWPPQCVTLMCRYGMKMIKQVIGLSQGLLWELQGPQMVWWVWTMMEEEAVCIFLGCSLVVKGGAKLEECIKLRVQSFQTFFFFLSPKLAERLVYSSSQANTGRIHGARVRQPDETIVTLAPQQVFKWDYMKARGMTDKWTQIRFHLFTLLQLC